MRTPSSHQIFYGDEVLEHLRRHAAPAARLLAICLQTAAVWHHRAHSRRQLALLDTTCLNDIGLSPDDARREARKPFWRA
jgi:uncharacterized protein YjiS (DUF1127 family)